jgi:hypothetical protein
MIRGVCGAGIGNRAEVSFVPTDSHDSPSLHFTQFTRTLRVVSGISREVPRPYLLVGRRKALTGPMQQSSNYQQTLAPDVHT